VAERGLGLPTPRKEDTMKKLIVVPAVLLLMACQDHNPVQPEPEVAPELAMALARGGPGNVVKMVPLKSKGTMWFVADGDDGPCHDVPGWEATSFIESEGTMTHMGRIASTFTNCMGEGLFLQRPLLAQFATSRAANGDLLYSQGLAADTDMPFSFIVNYSDWSWETRNVRIVGGTGRFENATGWWGCSGDNILAPRSNWTCEGEISSVGSSK
jgi:hypothetical protein